MELIDDFVSRYMLGSLEVGYSFWPSIGAFRGLLTLWDTNGVEVKFLMNYENLLIIIGCFKSWA